MAFESDFGPCPPRRAFCILQAWPKADVIEAVVALAAGRSKVISWKQVGTFFGILFACSNPASALGWHQADKQVPAYFLWTPS